MAAARASALARLREAYATPAGESIAASRLDDVDDVWPAATTQQVSVGCALSEGMDERIDPPEGDTCNDLENEWDAVAARTDVLRLEAKANYGKVVPKEDGPAATISYKEVWAWVSQLSEDTGVLKPLENRSSQDSRNSFLGSSLRRRSKSPGLDRQRGGKDIVLHLRATPFDFNTSIHFQMLRTIYSKLTLNKWCPSIGSHWEVLGFQSGDPRTDLNRSGGVLNILHLFLFVAHHPDLAMSCFQVSQDYHQNFPLACISINITNLVIESLSSGRLSALCGKETSELGVLELTSRLHNAGLFFFFSRWRSQKRTIEHTELTLNEIKALLDRKPTKLLEELPRPGQASRAKKPAALAMPEFADLEAMKEAMDGAVEKAPHRSLSRGLWARSKAAVLPKRLRRYQDENTQSFAGL